ncbi:mucin-binding protein [Lactococcus lactis]|uniref:mucin-binding protein n=1 Tax=Lactococcus lactis TaxID=1358 RepID=UPI0019129E78|nr:LPXTG cell wall anchor domain-containing protein [Lactococcus lactis]WDA67441.1 LPXTG cell wall anchor domain-containing protein [Lactococcus lactis]WDA67488.1 LPXTG cell wall anchor domain-containing protein [Lactococcus lactis]
MPKLKNSKKRLTVTAGVCMLALGSGSVLTTHIQSAYAESSKVQSSKAVREKNAEVNVPMTSSMNLRNGAVSNGKTAVTRTSDGFTANSPAENVESLTAKWVTDTSKITLTTTNAFYVNTPIEFSIKLKTPLQKNEEISIPLKINGTIFNTSSSYDFKDNITQNNGTDYTSQDGSFQYSYDEKAGQLKVKALDDRMLTDYSGMSLFLNNGWVPVPLRANPMLLDGGVAGNYGAKGSGATIKISVGDQTTSETVTNTEDIDFTTTLKPYNESIFDKGTEFTTHNTAGSSNNFLANTPLIKQIKNGKSQNLLDESTTHYVISAVTNAKFKNDSSPEKGISLETYIPIGSTSSGSPISAIAHGGTLDQFPEFKNVIKNVAYDKDKVQLSFDLSQKKADWQALAKALLANKNFGNTNGQRASWITDYLTNMANGNSDVNTTFTSLYSVQHEGFIPINNNFAIKVDVKATNSKSGKTTTQHDIVDPVHAGDDDATKAGVKIQTMDTQGDPIGEAQTAQYYSKGDSYKVSAPDIKGYRLIATNPKSLIDKLGITNVVEPEGTIDDSNIGQLYNVVYEYTKEVPITYSVIDDTDHKNLESKQSFFTTTVNEDVNTSENQDKLKSIEKGYTDKGYTLGQVEHKDLPAPTDEKGYDIVIHLSHGTKKEDVGGQNKTVKQTIHYQGAGNKTPKDNVQSMKFTSTHSETIDNVTGKVISKTPDVWSKDQQTKQIDSPKIEQYNVDKDKVQASTYKHDDKDKTIVVTYSPIKAPTPSSSSTPASSEPSGVLPTTGEKKQDVLVYGGVVVLLLAIGGSVYYKFKKNK